MRTALNTPYWIKILFKSGRIAIFYFNSLRTKQRWYKNLSETIGEAALWEFRTTRGLVTVNTLNVDIVGAS